MNQRHTTATLARPALLIAGLLLIAANLRAPVTAVAPILGKLAPAFDLTPTEAGLLTTLPLLAFGVISPFAATFAREYGMERALFAALAAIIGGLVIRSAGTIECLYLGTCVIGAGIAVGNVLLPGLIKRDFGSSVPEITGICALAMGGAAALASALVFPLANTFGWQIALVSVAICPLIALIIWRTQLGTHTSPPTTMATAPHGGRVWHSALAWQVTLFMGVNSLLYYVLVAWLPSILTATGFSATAAGSLAGAMQLATACPGLLMGPIVSRMKNQSLVAAAMAILMGVALLGLLTAPGYAMLWSVLFGFGSGGGVLLALIFMGLRAGSHRQAAALSGMAQCVGYLLAACGPILAGELHQVTTGWSALLGVCLTLTVVMAIFGLLAGRSRQIGASEPTIGHRERIDGTL